MGFCDPSSIQKKAILPLIGGKDVIAQGQSGTGKTCCFAIGCLELIDENCAEPQALILTPTRELALQNRDVVKTMGEHLGVRVECMIGGNTVDEDINKLNDGTQVVVGTPGRIYDLLNRRKFKTNKLKIFILDEADEMLDRGFKQKVKDIFRFLPKEGLQIGLFSATLKEDTLKITENFMNNPVMILVKNEELTLEGIRQYFCQIDTEDTKKEVVNELFRQIDIGLCIIYVNTKQKAEVLAEYLREKEFHVSVIHSDLDMSHRTLIMNNFRQGVTRILISTDLLARGIDVQQCNLVINYELPTN